MIFVFAAAIIIACGIFAGFFLAATKKKDYKSAFWLKGGASVCFVIAGLVFMGRCQDGRFALLVMLGLVGGILGDQLLALRFIYTKKHDLFFLLGMLAFAAGHICYIAALLGKEPASVKTALIYTAIGLVLSAAWIFGNKTKAPFKLMAPGGVYLLLLIFMGGCALGNALYNPGIGAWMLFAGGVMFALSDNILSVYSFTEGRSFGWNIALHALYYAAQMVIALSLGVIA